VTDLSPVRPGRPHLAFALDFPDLVSAKAVAAQVAGHVGVCKIGLELFIKEGPSATNFGSEIGCDIFLDLKLHDIPETVDRAVANACQLGVGFLTVHSSGGPRMLSQAAERVRKEGVDLTLLAVTVLTSLDESDLRAVGVNCSPAEQVLRLARMATNAGIRGFVCSAAEVGQLRTELGPDPVLVTPGIRPSGPASDDQKRVATPASAIRNGSSLLVVGRPIRDARDPKAAAAAIELEIAQALGK
jgi:orotidine-5'-phosphate decarboxylase